MYWESLDRDWSFQKGNVMLMQALGTGGFGKKVNLPHDYMIESDVKPDAPAGPAMGYFTEGAATYTKNLEIPAEWEGEKIFLKFDGAMMNASVSVNGSLVQLHHYGYTPFTVDITDRLYYGEKNRISVMVNPSMQPNSRWYSGAGIYRHVELAHANRIHIEPEGIFAYTVKLEGISDITEAGKRAEEAFLMAEVTVKNETDMDRQVKVRADLAEKNGGKKAASGESIVLVKSGSVATARVALRAENVSLWDADHPNLYMVKAEAEDMGTFSVRLNQEKAAGMVDQAETVFGIRTITTDAVHGLRINGETVKLKGGCIHHDNGLLGAVSLYDSEYRKLKNLKDAGFNAVRLAHNPPSKDLLQVCDEIGLYVFNEAFDAWGHSKQPGDYSQFFADHWKEDMAAFILRDRNHPSVILWSTGNEVEERGGMGNGYTIAEELAAYVRSLDPTRPVTNGLCSMWSGLDDKETMLQLMKMKEQMSSGLQNADLGKDDSSWEDRTEAFCNCLDVVGYNYMDNHYEYAGQRYPQRVILGTESYPNQIDKVWDLVEKLPYVIGDFTWTAYDYIGEAGIGKSGFFKADDPALAMGKYALSSHASQYPWRLANDADFTISGEITPQGIYRKIVWGSNETGLFVQHPKRSGLQEVVSAWGWNELSHSWNYAGYEGQTAKVFVYSAAPEVELLLNGRSLGKAAAGKENRYMAVFEVPYEAGVLTAVSSQAGTKISEATIETTGAPAAVVLTSDRTVLAANGESLAYVKAEIVDACGRKVPDAAVALTAEISGDQEICGLAGFGSDNPVTEDNYTSGNCISYQGKAMAILRSGYESGEVTLTVSAEGLSSAEWKISVK